MKTDNSNSHNFFPVSLVAVSAVFVLLFLLTLAIINLRLLFTSQTIKSRLQKSGFYVAAADQINDFLVSYLSGEEINRADLENWLGENLTPLWFQAETERNLDKLGEYLHSDVDQLELNLNLPLSQATPSSEERSFPDKVDLFGPQGLLPAEGTNNLYQFKVALEALNLSLKILIFLMALTVMVFFLLCSSVTACRWLGLSLGSAGLLGAVIANLLKLSSSFILSKLVLQRVFMIEKLQETITALLESFWQTYLSLISWQSLLALLVGALILLLSFLLGAKEEK